MSFGAGIWLWLLPGIAAATAAFLAWAARRRAWVLRTAMPTPLLQRLTAGLDRRRRSLKQAAWVGGILLAGLALARPQWGRETVKLERTGVDVLVALDVSRSMLAADVDGTNRVGAARAAIRRLTEALGEDRVGLIAFAGEAFVAAPLTRDHAAVERAVNALNAAAVSEQGSDLAKAIAKAREGFVRGGEGPRALLLISDGEQLQGEAVTAAREAAAAGITVHCAGVGSLAGARIPASADGYPPGYVKNAFGRDVVSRVDEPRLQQIAAAGRGLYVRLAGRNSNALVDWFARASAGLPRTSEQKELGDPRERFQWPLAGALASLSQSA
jgi:Ca-activated chloride channel family protein